MFGRKKNKTENKQRKKLDEIIVDKVEGFYKNYPIGGSLVSEIFEEMENEKREAELDKKLNIPTTKVKISKPRDIEPTL